MPVDPGGMIIPWRGEVWRSHNAAYVGDSTVGSRRFSGRYNVGLDSCPEGTDWEDAHRADIVWEALYTGLSWGICLAEANRHLTEASLRARLRALRFSQLRLDLDAVLDCSDVMAWDFDSDQLFHDTDYTYSQQVAGRARALACEGLLIPSAARIPGAEGLVLIVFPDRLQPTSAVRVVRTVDPKLSVDRP